MKPLVLATRNQHKVTELRRMFHAFGHDVELVGVDAFDNVPEVRETGTSFADNALLKARAVAEATGLVSIADDSGLCVDVMGGMPGIFSARWSGQHGDDAANVALLLAQIEEIPDELRTAQFVCAAALAEPGDAGRAFEGKLRGSLTRAPRGANGFGYDPIFVPEGEQRTSAELSADEKDAISHRGRAFRALSTELGSIAG